MTEPTDAATDGGDPDDKQRQLGAVAYVLTWLTGLVVFLISDEEQEYARWHAIQAIGLGVVLVGAFILLSILSAIVATMDALSGGFLATTFLGLLYPLLWLATLVLIVLLAVKTYQGDTIRLPFLAGLADKNA